MISRDEIENSTHTLNRFIHSTIHKNLSLDFEMMILVSWNQTLPNTSRTKRKQSQMI